MVASVNKTAKGFMKMELIPLKLLKMFPRVTEYEENVKIYDIQRRFIFREIEQHEQTLDANHSRDFIDVYLKEIKDNDTSDDYNKRDLAVSMWDFLQAGTETSSTTLKWIVLYLTLYQDVQDK